MLKSKEIIPFVLGVMNQVNYRMNGIATCFSLAIPKHFSIYRYHSQDKPLGLTYFVLPKWKYFAPRNSFLLIVMWQYILDIHNWKCFECWELEVLIYLLMNTYMPTPSDLSLSFPQSLMLKVSVIGSLVCSS